MTIFRASSRLVFQVGLKVSSEQGQGNNKQMFVVIKYNTLFGFRSSTAIKINRWKDNNRRLIKRKAQWEFLKECRVRNNTKKHEDKRKRRLQNTEVQKTDEGNGK